MGRPACSSSFVALNDAVADLQRGRIDYAMVGGSSALFRPATTVAFHQLQCARCPRMQLHRAPFASSHQMLSGMFCHDQ